MGDTPYGLFSPPAINRVKTSAPEKDFTIELADHRGHQIQGMREYVELLLELRFPRFALRDVAGNAVESHRSTVRIARDRCVVFQPAHLAIGTDDAVLDGHGTFFH